MITKNGVSLPEPFNHPTTLAQAMLFRRGAVVIPACTNCTRGNSRFKLCVKLLDPGCPFAEDFYNGACANCLPNATTTYSISKSHPNEVVTSTNQDCFKVEATSLRHRQLLALVVALHASFLWLLRFAPIPAMWACTLSECRSRRPTITTLLRFWRSSTDSILCACRCAP